MSEQITFLIECRSLYKQGQTTIDRVLTLHFTKEDKNFHPFFKHEEKFEYGHERPNKIQKKAGKPQDQTNSIFQVHDTNSGI